MQILKALALVSLVMVLVGGLAYAQAPGPGGEQPPFQQLNEEEAAAACAAGCGVLLVLAIVFYAIAIAIAVWVFKDAKSRGENGALWLIIVLLTGLIGLIIYLLARTKGNLTTCPHCNNKRLEGSAQCPHCGKE